MRLASQVVQVRALNGGLDARCSAIPKASAGGEPEADLDLARHKGEASAHRCQAQDDRATAEVDEPRVR